MIKICMIGIFSLSLLAETPASTTELVTAQKYLEIYSSFKDFERLMPFYTESTIFEDVPSNMQTVGGKKIISELSRFFDSYEIRVHSQHQFSLYSSHNGWIIASQMISLSMTQKKTGEDPLFLTAPGLILLQIRDGKVIRHQDYPDYPSLEPQLTWQDSPLASKKKEWLPSWKQIDTYFTTYTDFSDFSALTPFYTKETVFEDPGWGSRFVGDQIIPGLQKASAGLKLQTNHIHYLSRFRTRGGQVIINGLFSAVLKSQGKQQFITIPMVVVLEFDKQGKVVMHRDFPDYREMNAQLTSNTVK